MMLDTLAEPNFVSSVEKECYSTWGGVEMQKATKTKYFAPHNTRIARSKHLNLN